jgi:chitinase
MLLTIPIGWINTNYMRVADFTWMAKGLVPFFDQINLMTYDMDNEQSQWGWTKIWHCSAITGESPLYPSSVNSSVSWFVDNNVIPKAKLGVGIGAFGCCWVGPTAPLQVAGNSRMVATDSNCAYNDITTLYAPNMTSAFDASAGAPYLFSSKGVGYPNAITYISYEDEQSIALKLAYVQSQGLGGVILWTASQVPSLPVRVRISSTLPPAPTLPNFISGLSDGVWAQPSSGGGESGGSERGAGQHRGARH